MQPIDKSDIPHNKHDAERAAEINAFVECDAICCTVEMFTNNLRGEYDKYKQKLWRMGLSGKIKPFTHYGKLYLKKIQKE